MNSSNNLYLIYKNTINNLINILNEFSNKGNIYNILFKDQYRRFYLGILLVFIGIVLNIIL